MIIQSALLRVGMETYILLKEAFVRLDGQATQRSHVLMLALTRLSMLLS
jgi:hypothetical protein